jgi:hypothetical protein
MKMNDRKGTQGPAFKHDFRALLVLSLVVGAWLGIGIYLLVLQALQG